MTGSLIYSHRFLGSLVHFLVDSLTSCLVASVIHWFIVSPIHWFIGSFTQLSTDFFMSFHWHLRNNLLICWCFNRSWFLHLKHIPIGHWFLVVISCFRNFRPGACQALFGRKMVWNPSVSPCEPSRTTHISFHSTTSSWLKPLYPLWLVRIPSNNIY